MAWNRLVTVSACAALAALAALAVRAQDPDSRRIDTMPKLEIRPPAGEGSGAPAEHPGDPPQDEGSAAARPDRNHRLQLELEQKERRDTLPAGGKPARDYLALAVIVTGSGLILLLVVVWVSRRRNR